MSDLERAATYYSRWSRIYDFLARYTPGITRLRSQCIQRLNLQNGMTVIDMGAGPGPNFPHLRNAISPDGTVVGIDVSRGQLERAKRLCNRNEWTEVAIIRGDASNPPVRDADAIFGSFVIGMFENPATVVDRWCDIIGPGGRIGLLHFATSRRWYGLFPNIALQLLVSVSTPDKSRGSQALTRLLDERIRAAESHVSRRCLEVQTTTHWGGIVRLTTGIVAEQSED